MSDKPEIICQGCEKPGGTKELHACPYASEINDDDSEQCNCCDDCERTCAQDI